MERGEAANCAVTPGVEIHKGDYRMRGQCKNARRWNKRVLEGRKQGRKIAFLATAVLGLLGSATGCSSLSGFKKEAQYSRGWDDFVSGYRNTAWSAKAWHCRKHQFCNERYLHDFCSGFRAGYEAISDGDNGCTPAFPSREYWGWKHQSAEGQAKVSAWFSGYPHGARAAEEDGVGNWTQIQTSSGIQSEYAQFGKMPNAQVGIYPIPAMGGQPTGQTLQQELPSKSTEASASDRKKSELDESLSPQLRKGSRQLALQRLFRFRQRGKLFTGSAPFLC